MPLLYKGFNREVPLSSKMSDTLSEPLIEKDEAEWLESKRTTQSRVYIALTVLQAVTACLIPTAYYLGYQKGVEVVPKLLTHRRLFLLRLKDLLTVYN